MTTRGARSITDIHVYSVSITLTTTIDTIHGNYRQRVYYSDVGVRRAKRSVIGLNAHSSARPLRINTGARPANHHNLVALHEPFCLSRYT